MRIGIVAAAIPIGLVLVLSGLLGADVPEFDAMSNKSLPTKRREHICGDAHRAHGAMSRDAICLCIGCTRPGCTKPRTKMNEAVRFAGFEAGDLMEGRMRVIADLVQQ